MISSIRFSSLRKIAWIVVIILSGPMNIPDNSKFERMVSNRPPVSILPTVNKRLISQFTARSLFAAGVLAAFGGIFLYKFFLNANSRPFLKSRKAFRWESDPYTGQVSCTYQEQPNDAHNY